MSVSAYSAKWKKEKKERVVDVAVSFHTRVWETWHQPLTFPSWSFTQKIYFKILLIQFAVLRGSLRTKLLCKIYAFALFLQCQFSMRFWSLFYFFSLHTFSMIKTHNLEICKFVFPNPFEISILFFFILAHSLDILIKI